MPQFVAMRDLLYRVVWISLWDCVSATVNDASAWTRFCSSSVTFVTSFSLVSFLIRTCFAFNLHFFIPVHLPPKTNDYSCVRFWHVTGWNPFFRNIKEYFCMFCVCWKCVITSKGTLPQQLWLLYADMMMMMTLAETGWLQDTFIFCLVRTEGRALCYYTNYFSPPFFVNYLAVFLLEMQKNDFLYIKWLIIIYFAFSPLTMS